MALDPYSETPKPLNPARCGFREFVRAFAPKHLSSTRADALCLFTEGHDVDAASSYV